MNADYSTVLLEKVKFGVITRLSKEFAIGARVDADVVAGFAEDELVIRVTQSLLCQKLATVEAKWPADWREAVKERFAPKWFLRRWPVNYEWRVLDAKVLYPQIALPDDRHYLQLAIRHGYDL